MRSPGQTEPNCRRGRKVLALVGEPSLSRRASGGRIASVSGPIRGSRHANRNRVIFLRKHKACAIRIASENPAAFGQAVSRWRRDEIPFETIRSKPETGKDFFIWIRCNTLKRLNSAKEIQGNPSFFAWISLVLFGFVWRRAAAWQTAPSRAHRNLG